MDASERAGKALGMSNTAIKTPRFTVAVLKFLKSTDVGKIEEGAVLDKR